MSQFKDQDKKIVKTGANSHQIHVYDAKKGQFVDRYHGDAEGIANITEDLASGRSDFHPTPIGYDQSGNPIYRLKKYMPK